MFVPTPHDLSPLTCTQYKAGKEHTNVLGKAAVSPFKTVVSVTKKQGDELCLLEARTVMDAVRTIDIPDAFVEVAYSFSFSRSQLFRAFSKGYARAKASMGVSGRYVECVSVSVWWIRKA
jgi:hypothetical protein